MNAIAFLGTGLIGAGMVEAARKRGVSVKVWNRTKEKAEALAPLGVEVAARIEDAVKGVTRVHIAVSDDAAVDAILARALPALERDTIVIDHTTASPKGVVARAERAASEGFGFVHAPVFMSPAAAKAAKGLILCAGMHATFDAVKDELSAMTGEVWYLGERPDLAAAYKLFGNATIIALIAALADVHAMAKNLGISPSVAQELFAKFKPAGVIDARGPKIAAGDYTASFEMTMARKDVRLMIEAAGGEALAVLPAIASRMDELIERGHGALDLSALAMEAVPPKA